MIDHIEIVFDPEDRQVAIFYIFENGEVIEKHYRKLLAERYIKITEIHKKFDELITKKRYDGNREFIYSDFNVVKAFEDALDMFFSV